MPPKSQKKVTAKVQDAIVEKQKAEALASYRQKTAEEQAAKKKTAQAAGAVLDELKSLVQGKAGDDHVSPMAIRAASKARTRRTKKPWNPEVTATPKKPAEPVTDQVRIPTPPPLPVDLRMDASPRQQADLGISSELLSQLAQSQSRIADGIAALTQGMTALLQGRQSPTSSIRIGSSHASIRAASQAGSQLSAASYQRTADWVRASSEALSDSVKSQSQPKSVMNVQSHSKVAGIKKKSVVINDEDSDASSGSSHVTSVSHKAKDSRSEVSVESSKACSLIAKATSDVSIGMESATPVAKAKKQVSPGACSSDIKLKAYTGDGYVEQYLEQFRHVAAANHWPESVWGTRLIAALEGKARTILTVEKLPTNPPFKLVAKRLKEHFASDASEELWLNELELLRRGEKETIPQLAHKVMDKLPKAFPRMTKKDRERLGIRYFTKALIDPQQRLDIRKARPKTLSAAVELALTTENATKEDAYLQARYAKGSQGYVTSRPQVTAQRVRMVECESGEEESGSDQGRGRRNGRRARQKSAERAVKALSQEKEAEKTSADGVARLSEEVKSVSTSMGGLVSYVAEIGQQVRALAQRSDGQAAVLFRAPMQQQQSVRNPPPMLTSPVSPGQGALACWICGSQSHLKRECPKWQGQWGNPATQRQGNERSREMNGHPLGSAQ